VQITFIARKSTRLFELFFLLKELKADTGRKNQMKFATAPQLHFERADLRRDIFVLGVERFEIRNANAETGVVGSFAIAVFNEHE